MEVELGYEKGYPVASDQMSRQETKPGLTQFYSIFMVEVVGLFNSYYSFSDDMLSAKFISKTTEPI
jgi:hypothetical protein